MDSLTDLKKNITSVLKPDEEINIAFDFSACQDLYKGHVVEILPGEIVINVTTERHIPTHTRCWTFFSHMDQRYSFETTLKKYRGVSPELIVLEHPLEVQISERREFVRVPVKTLISFRVSRGSEENNGKTFFGTAKNMSAGGILMVTDEKIPDKSDLLMSFDLTDEAAGRNVLEVKNLKGRIVRGFELEFKVVGEAYTYGIKFREISDHLNEKINHFIVRRQIELKKKV